MKNKFFEHLTNQIIREYAVAVLTVAICLPAITPLAFGQAQPPATADAPRVEPLHTVIPVHIDATTGDIQVGRTTYHGTSPGFHLLALKRQPDPTPALRDQPDLIQDQVVPDATAANTFLQDALSSASDALLIVNGVGNHGVALSAIAKNLEMFGAQTDIEPLGAGVPFTFIGNGGKNKGGALQRGYSPVPIDGYLATDSNGNYTFFQTDYLRYDITADGTITIGSAPPYTVAGSTGCTLGSGFHIVVVSRELPESQPVFNNTYCTNTGDAGLDAASFSHFAGDLLGQGGSWGGNTINFSAIENYLVFVSSAGKPIPPDWNFGTDGDGRVYPVAHNLALFGAYFETLVYLSPNDTYSFVGAAAPPAYVPNARSRAREFSTVYPDAKSGELHGILARGRGNWYSPINGEPSGLADRDFYDKVLAQPSTVVAPYTSTSTFPPYANDPNYQAKLDAFQDISSYVCGQQGCNIRDKYADSLAAISNYLTNLTSYNETKGTGCSITPGQSSIVCQEWQQILTELEYVNDIHLLASNLSTLGTINGVNTVFDLINTWQTVQNTLPTPVQPTASNLVSPIVNLVFGLASAAPTPLAPLFGIADAFFNLGTTLTTDQSGNQMVSLAGPVANLADQAKENFDAQMLTVGTQFNLIYQNWAKLQPLGQFLANAAPGTSWYWDASVVSTVSEHITPAIKQSMYQSLMSAVYAIAAYVPETPYNCSGNGPWPVWGQFPIWQQPRAYTVEDVSFKACGAGETPVVQPFYFPAPYTFPSDAANPSVSNTQTGTILADGGWLGISLQTSQTSANANGTFDPPDASLLGTLFNPVSNGGVGVYRPAFFESWPFPRVNCYPSYGVSWGDGIYTGGCNWGAGTAPLEALPAPSTKLAIATHGVTRTGTQVKLQLMVHNNGSQKIASANLSSITLRTVSGAGQASVVGPAIPSTLGEINPGAYVTIPLTLDVPPGVTKLQITESGTVNSGETDPYKFSLGQVIFPNNLSTR